MEVYVRESEREEETERLISKVGSRRLNDQVRFIKRAGERAEREMKMEQKPI